jgi:hypothetical protein
MGMVGFWDQQRSMSRTRPMLWYGMNLLPRAVMLTVTGTDSKFLTLMITVWLGKRRIGQGRQVLRWLLPNTVQLKTLEFV